MARRRTRRPPATASPATPRRPAAADPRLVLADPLRQLFPAGLPAPPPTPPPPPPPPPPPTPMTERDLMAAAYAGRDLDFSQIEIVAFPARPPALATAPASESESDADADAEHGDVTPASTTTKATTTTPLALGPWAGKRWRDQGLACPPLEVDALRDPERGLLAEAARQREVPTLKLRGLRRGPALAALADRVALARAAGLAFLRVVTGKGVGSPGAPILKEAVVTWCSGEGSAEVAGLAPERDRFGEYGALILRLRRRTSCP